MTKKYDLIVVGAGPSGLLAAKAAGLAGFRVALIERKTDIRRLDRMCGQTLVSANDYYFDDLVHYNRQGKSIGFLKNGFSFAYDGPVKNLNGWNVYSPNGNCMPFGTPAETRKKGDWGPVGFAYDKEILFACLLGEARDAGVEVVTGIDITAVETMQAGVRVSGGGQTFEAAYLIAADGTNSRIARLLGFNEGRTFYSYLLSTGWNMRGLKLPEQDILISGITYKTAAPGSMFIFPRPYANEHMVVFLALEPAVDLKDVARAFMHESAFFAPWFRGAEQVRQLSSSQYIYAPVLDPYRNRVLLAGDTGACQELENTGAMISGWKAGNAVAAALKEDNTGIGSRAIAEYVQWWTATYIEKCSPDAYLMNFALPYVLDTEDDLNYLFSLVGEPLPPCWNPYAAIAHIGQLMQTLVPRIQKERPDIMMKLAKMSRPMTEVLAAATRACEPRMELK
ncbi:MAG: FAD-dependent monooxygenase [Pseudomonadota bacterium]